MKTTKIEFNFINGDLLKAIKKGASIVADVATTKDIIVLVKNPNGYEWKYSVYYFGDNVDEFVLYGTYNFTFKQCLKIIHESRRDCETINNNTIN